MTISILSATFWACGFLVAIGVTFWLWVVLFFMTVVLLPPVFSLKFDHVLTLLVPSVLTFVAVVFAVRFFVSIQFVW